MKKTTRKLLYESNTLAGLLFEQEEDLFADDAGDEEEAPAEEEADEPEGDEEAPAEEDAEGEGEEEDEKLDVDAEEEVKLSKSIDQDLEALLIDFEADARKSRQIDDEGLVAAEEAIAENSLRLGLLIEQEGDDFEQQLDIDRFTSEVARLVKNYTTLLDMEKMIVSKAREFILTRYGAKAETMMLDILNANHDIAIDEPVAPGDQSTPIAVGAGSGAAGGAA